MNNTNCQIVSCSGASKTGKFADEIARKLVAEGKVKMLCLARFSVDTAFANESKKDLDRLIVLDGCSINCAQKTMYGSGITAFEHIHITDFGIIKGKTPFSPEKAKKIVDHIQSIEL
ncbi:MAG: putative zinc-binding protein [Bacteroidales bacterium]|nr:MAG: putative zinc-binding protein [Bacteroidales bacterium]